MPSHLALSVNPSLVLKPGLLPLCNGRKDAAVLADVVARGRVYQRGCTSSGHLTNCEMVRIPLAAIVVAFCTCALLMLTRMATSDFVPFLLAIKGIILPVVFTPVSRSTPLGLECFRIVVGVRVPVSIFALDAHVQNFDRQYVDLHFKCNT